MVSILSAVTAEAIPFEEVSIDVKFGSTQFQLDRSTLEIPLHYSGYEIELTNEEEYKKKLNPKTGELFHLKAQVIGTTPGTFLGLHADERMEHGAGYLIKYSLKIISAEKAENNPRDSSSPAIAVSPSPY